MNGVINGFPYNEEVEGEAPMLDVPDVFLHATFHLPQFRSLSTEPCNLCVSRDAGFCEVAYHVASDELAILFRVLEHVRTWTDDAHVAQPDIYELWQLVDTGSTHELTDACLARVVLCGLNHITIYIDAHRAELIAIELLAVQS